MQLHKNPRSNCNVSKFIFRFNYYLAVIYNFVLILILISANRDENVETTKLV